MKNYHLAANYLQNYHRSLLFCSNYFVLSKYSCSYELQYKLEINQENLL